MAFLLFHLWHLWPVMAVNGYPWSRGLLGDRCCWGGEWACWKDRRAMGLKAGHIEMAGMLFELRAKLGCLRAEGKLKPSGGCSVEVGFVRKKVRFFPSSPTHLLLPHSCLVPLLLCLGDHSPHGGSHSRCWRSPGTHHQQALTSPAIQAAMGQICQERWYLWLDLLIWL